MGLPINKLCCPHCLEENPNYFKFGTLDAINQQYKFMSIPGNNYEFIPKKSIGFYFWCSKCKKHTVIIPDNYEHKEFSSDIPYQIIYTPTFQEPEVSATSYIMYNNGLLDQIVTVKSGAIMSLITRQPVINDGSWREIDKAMYDICISKGFQEVSNNENKSTNDATNNANDGAASSTVYKSMEQYVGATTTTNVSPISTNDSTTNNATIKTS